MTGRRSRRALWLALLVALVAGVGAISLAPDRSGGVLPGQVPLDDDTVGRLFDEPLPGLSDRSATPTATGTSSADARIRQVALARGYRLRGEPLDPMGSYQGRLLQQRAIDDLVDLQAALLADEGVSLTITSAQRTATRQRQLFLSQINSSSFALRGRLVTNNEIGLGLADDVLNHAMALAAPPGFSRHHTGLVIDVSSQGLGLFAFATTRAYAWLSDDSYANAMAHGWVPSYPPGASGQGPNPEPWEWAWIGRDAAECALERSCADGSLDAAGDGRTRGWATTPTGQPAHALRLRTAEGTERLTVAPVTRFDVVAAVGADELAVGFSATERPATGDRWACVEARTRASGPWNRIGCLDLT